MILKAVEKIRMPIETLPPAYFAMVMSTGIVSIGCYLMGPGDLARPLFWLNLGLYLALGLLHLVRLWRYPRQVLADLRSHPRGPGFFTLVAATCILGSQLALFWGATGWASLCLAVGAGLWLFFVYAVLAALITNREKPSLTAGLGGLWLVLPVSAQALSILATLVVSRFYGYEEGFLFVSLCLFLAGGLLSLLLNNLMVYRLLFLPLDPEEFEPPYWIIMGVNAISTVAGSVLAATRYGPRLLEPLQPALVLVTVFFWSAATWWLPLLTLLMVWRHLIRRVKLSYAPSLWGLVFPLGMYAVCTWDLAETVGFPGLRGVARVVLYVALAAWLLTFVGFLRAVVRSWFRGQDSGTR